MSNFRVPVVQIGKIGKHPNADSLSITTVEGCPCIFRTGDFEEGNIAIYIPVDAVVPETVPGTEFLGKKRRIKAAKLRGIFSMGILLPLFHTGTPIIPMTHQIGDDVAGALGITKYEEPIPLHMQSEMAPAPKTLHYPPTYDMESYRKYKHLLVPGEDIVVTEKIHGTNSRFVYFDDAMHVGSHHGWKKLDESNLWWRIAKQYNLESVCKEQPGMILYGETYGQVQDLRYGTAKNELKLALFDIFDSALGMWLDYESLDPVPPVYSFVEFCKFYDLPMVSVLYKGPYIPEVVEPMCDGPSVVSTVEQIREGVVIKPTRERWNQETGRTIFKLVGESYLTRKGGTELH
jgi:RNA ligase (TIGR02306 family)